MDPFHDRRCIHVRTVWNFDLDSDVLRCNKKDHKLWIPLSVVREHPVTISDFKPYEPPILPEYPLESFFRKPHSKLKRTILDLQRLKRDKAFISRLLSDFAFQWRHILCSRYNKSTFQKLAYAIIRIATLNFSVVEETRSRQGLGGFHVWIHQLPEWDPPRGNFVRVGGTTIVMSQHIPHALTPIQEDFAKREFSIREQNTSNTAERSYTYLILSVREVFLYQISSESVRYTKPERLYDGTHPPSNEAINLLLEATQTSLPTSPIHDLPIELQDMILDHVSAGPIERAKVSCKLNIGSSFLWKCGDRAMEREESHTNRTPWSLVESQIMFGNHFSGVVYK